MSINTNAYAQKFTEELDKMYVQDSVTGFLADNILRAKFVGAKTVVIPDVDMQGLADYDRETGFIRGAITVAQQPFTMSRDRGRSLEIDREDLDETGASNLAGQILSEFVRTKVIPESDAYTISKLAGVASTQGHLLQGGSLSAPYAAFIDMVANVRDVVGYGEELVCLMHPAIYKLFQTSADLSRSIVSSDFKQGEINLTVNSIDGVALLPVTADRMYTAYDFLNGSATGEEDGGFTPLSSAKAIYMLVMPKKAASLVKKTEKMRTFTPEQNLTKDAYKFDYRIYFDVFVKKSKKNSIWGWIAPSINISAQPVDISVAAGASGTLSVTATASDASALTYQWYSCDSESGLNPVMVVGANAATLATPTSLVAGTHYYFVKVTAGNATAINSEVAKVTVA